MNKIYLYVLLAGMILFGVSAAQAQTLVVPPLKFQLPIVGAKETQSFSELDRLAARHKKDNDAIRIDKNLTLGQIRPSRDFDHADFHRRKGGFGLKGEWLF